ncbi:Helicase MOV-10 [Mactra antiquata]
MVRNRNRPSYGETDRAVNEFLNYLKAQEYPDALKRDEFKTAYDNFYEQYERANTTQGKIPYRFVMKHLKEEKLIHELGDYYAFSQDVQALFERLQGSDEHRQIVQKWQAMAQENPNFCKDCGIDCETEKNLESHENGQRHRIHKFQNDVCMRKTMFMPCPKGVEITSDPPASVETSFIERQTLPKQTQYMTINIKNKNAENILIFQRYMFLWETDVFKLTWPDDKNRWIPKTFKRHIPPRTSFEMKVKCVAPSDFGHHFVPLGFFIGWKNRHHELIEDDGNMQEFVLRFVSTHVIGDLHKVLAPTAPFERPKQIEEDHFVETVPGVPIAKSAKNILAMEYKLQIYRIPNQVRNDASQGLDENLRINSDRLRSTLEARYSPTTYQKKFDTLLWLEELQMNTDIKHYDLMNVTMTTERNSNFMILKVPGLMERRPSVLKGDRVFIYIPQNRSLRFEADVHFVRMEEVVLGVSPRLRESWVRGSRYDIRFDYMKFNFWMQHRALRDLPFAETILFPKESTTLSTRQKSLKPWFYRELNPEQQKAVTNIVQGTSRPAPYMIFGPPGTGKTVTVTEAIRQVYHGQPEAKILICCPENTAADYIMKKLINKNIPGTVQMKDIYRMYATSRDFRSVPNEIKESNRYNYDKTDDDFFYPSQTELKKIKILIVTLSTAGRLVSAPFPRNHFTHIFIDEAAHAVEPECIVPITGLMDCKTKNCPHLILAGDPKQLGPILRSLFSLNYGLELSLLERLMNDFPEYRKSETSGYNTRFITKLVRNYRSHDSILEVPRSLFYDGELQACGDPMITNCMLTWPHLPNKKMPIIFHAVFGKSEREASSPSYFNRDEIAQVEKYLHLLLNDKKKGLKVLPKDIGIISPYRKQVQKLRDMIKKKNFGRTGEIIVGSVEEFQGQENKIIIISTVRSQDNCVHEEPPDGEHNIKISITQLGFVRNPKRFNVALTRARSLLIVVGNPLSLEKDPNWKKFLDHCDSNRCYKGQHGRSMPQGQTASESVTYDRDLSVRQQAEDVEFTIRD